MTNVLSRRILYYLLLSVSLFCGSGWFIFGDKDDDRQLSIDGPRPEILTVYYPYEVNERAKTGITPLPDYKRWTIERMERDIARMRAAGIDGILLCISPSDSAEPQRLSMIQRFLDKCSITERPFKVILTFAPRRPLVLDYANIAQFIEHKGITSYKALCRVNDSILVCLSENVVVNDENESVYGFTFSKVTLAHPALPCPTPAPTQATKSPLPMEFVFAGFCDINSMPQDERYSWSIPRKKGKAFGEGLAKAIESKASTIVIVSWNDYSNGSSIENNTQDGTMLLDVLAETMMHYVFTDNEH